MKIIIASSNQGKIKEFEQLLPNIDIKPYTHYLEKFEIEETGSSFQENAIIKAKAIYDKLPNKKDIVVISDDSGISVCALNNEPNIYSARYAKPDATDDENNQKLISKLKEKHLTKTPAYYTASIALIYNNQIFTTHGWMWGDVIDTLKGDGGFGYDPMFIPTGFDQTLGELDPAIKKGISHRTKALNLALKILKLF
jgi:XTP/dITP diphosphohydrolase